jgi:hypothetical protein
MFNFSEDKLDDEMLECLRSLSAKAERCGAEEGDVVKFLFLDRILTDALRHLGTKLSESEYEDLLKHFVKSEVSTLKEIAKELVSILEGRRDPNRTLLFSLDKELKKEAYPIRVDTAVYTGIKKNFPSLASRAASLISSGAKEADAIRRVISDLDLDDRLAFLSWYGLKYKSGRNLGYLSAEEDVLIKKVAYGPEGSDSAFVYEFMRKQPAPEAPVEQPARDHHTDPMSAEEFKKMRDKMVGRTFAIDKLLEKYRHLLKEEQFDAVEDSLNVLRKSIRKLKVATLHDVIEKVAFTAEQNDWFEGADVIRKIAAPDEAFVKVANSISRPDDLEAVLRSLEEISAFLRQRAIIRELSARDIDIFNLGFGHMPEIGDAAAKLMEAFNGSANKIDDLVGKLRAELQQQIAPKMVPSVVKTVVKPQDLPLVKALEPAPPEAPEGTTELATPAAPPPTQLPKV